MRHVLARLALATALVLPVSPAAAQTTEEPLVLLADNTLNFQTMTAMPDGGFVIVAQELVSYDVGVDPVLHIFRADSSGRREWNYVINRVGVQMALASAVGSTGDVYVGGLDGSEVPTRGLTQLFTSFQPGGRVVTDTLIGGSLEDTISGMAPLPNGDILTVGRFREFAEEGGRVRDSDIVVQRLSPDGTQIWTASQRGRGQESYPLMAETAGGYYFATVLEGRRVQLSRIDVDGQAIDDVATFSIPRRGQLNGFLATPDGGFVMAVTMGDSGGHSAQLVKVSAQGDVLWRESIDGNTTLSGAALLPSGMIVVAGTTDGKDLTTEAWLRGFDQSGAQAWSGAPRRPVETMYGTNEPVGPDFVFETRAGGVVHDGAGGVFFAYMPLSRAIPAPALPLVVEHMRVE